MRKEMKLKQNKKAYPSWDRQDFKTFGEEPPDCVENGQTEGQLMPPEEVEEWCALEIKSLAVIREEYPEKFEGQYEEFSRDLDYLLSLGKITKAECKQLKKKDNFEPPQKSRVFWGPREN